MFGSTLQRPDDDLWHDDWGHSNEIAARLVAVYLGIRRSGGHINGYQQAIHELLPLLKWRMSRRQRLHLYFLLSSSFAALDEYAEALCWIDRALGISQWRDLTDEQIDL